MVCVIGAQEGTGIALMALQVRSLEDHVLVLIEAQPPEPLKDRASAFVRTARLVRILDTEKEIAPESPSVEPVEERRSPSADVQIPGGRGRETKAWASHRIKESRRCGYAGEAQLPPTSSRLLLGVKSGDGGIRTLDRALYPITV